MAIPSFSPLRTKTDIEQKQTNLMLRRQVDGLVIIPVSDNDRYYSGEAFSRVHVVTVDRPAPGSRFDSVLVPNRSGAKTAVEHLISHGHKSIGFLGLSRKLFTMKARYAGYREAMSDAGHRPEPYVDCGSAERTVAVVRSMLNSRKPPTALFAANNLTMRYLLHALSAAAVNIPRQIAVAGFDDFEMADVLQPSHHCHSSTCLSTWRSRRESALPAALRPRSSESGSSGNVAPGACCAIFVRVSAEDNQKCKGAESTSHPRCRR
ncbi:MAG: substrate-binding domain-containing protein [Acidobacteriaceae bacterium]